MATMGACAPGDGGADGGSSDSGSASTPSSDTTTPTDAASTDATTPDTTDGPVDTSSAGTDATDDTSPTGDPACRTSLGDDPEPRFERPHGLFTLRDAEGYTSFVGSVTIEPPLAPHHETERDGQCRLLRFEATTCTPACDFGVACLDGTCVAPPPPVSAGDLVLDGVGDGPHPVADDGLHTYYWDEVGDPALDMPRLTATGDEVPAFDLSVCPTTAPTSTEDWSLQMEARGDGESVTLQWSDPIPTARIYMRMTTGIGTHGGISPVEIECEGPDTGELVLPGAFLDALYAEGWGCGECGDNTLWRYHGDQTQDAAPVQFRSAAATTFWYRP